jgi:hypothetical protein
MAFSITQQSLQSPESLVFKWFVFLFTRNHLNSVRSLAIGCREKWGPNIFMACLREGKLAMVKFTFETRKHSSPCVLIIIIFVAMGSY